MNGFTKDFDRKNEGIFYDSITDYIIHVEDKGQGAMYEELFEKIFDKNTKYEVLDGFSGKNEVLEEALRDKKNRNSKYIYLLDKDFDDKKPNEKLKKLKGYSYNELKKNPEIKYLKRYSIENYLMNLEGIKGYLKLNGIKNSEMLDLENVIEEIKVICIEISKMFLYNNYYGIRNEQKIRGLVKLEKMKYLDDQPSRYIGSLKSGIEEELYSLQMDNITTIFNENDIVGKDLLEAIRIRSGIIFKLSSHLKEQQFRNYLVQKIGRKELEEFKEIILS